MCSSALTTTISFLPWLKVTSVLETWAWDTCGTCWNVVPVFWGNKSRRGPRTLSVEQVRLFLSNSTSLFSGMYKKYFLNSRENWLNLNFYYKISISAIHSTILSFVLFCYFHPHNTLIILMSLELVIIYTLKTLWTDRSNLSYLALTLRDICTEKQQRGS